MIRDNRLEKICDITCRRFGLENKTTIKICKVAESDLPTEKKLAKMRKLFAKQLRKEG